MTVLDFLRASGRLVGALHPGQTGNQDENDVALEALNSMLGNWNTHRWAPHSTRQDTWTLTAGTGEYTIGPGGDFDAVRPVKIERASLILSGSDPARRDLDVIDVDRWADIALPSVQSIPRKLYNDGAHPLALLRFHPVPDSAYSVILYTRQKLGPFTALNEVADFPDGYEEAIKYNLAVRLAAEFRLPVPAFVERNARYALADVMRVNIVTPRLRCEVRGSDYDIRVGE
jgi:hypothetical protein